MNMLLNKLKQHDIDLFIKIVDDHNHYIATPFEFHSNYKSFKLSFSFEDWSDFYDDGKQHIENIAKYINANGTALIKYQDEDFDKLCEKLQTWCKEHKQH